MQRKRIVELAGKYRLPAIYSLKEFGGKKGRAVVVIIALARFCFAFEKVLSKSLGSDSVSISSKF
ncbi:MAG: hypothetical protein AUH87_03470 [Deltaproteobacteria bacterium 13_1_40CM_4_54_4]|nr:MAG: hypothetical protein AUH87_03470 [Deltaproteobacteria bacterium 13_1_40CM_4_54_4]